MRVPGRVRREASPGRRHQPVAQALPEAVHDRLRGRAAGHPQRGPRAFVAEAGRIAEVPPGHRLPYDPQGSKHEHHAVGDGPLRKGEVSVEALLQDHSDPDQRERLAHQDVPAGRRRVSAARMKQSIPEESRASAFSLAVPRGSSGSPAVAWTLRPTSRNRPTTQDATWPSPPVTSTGPGPGRCVSFEAPGSVSLVRRARVCHFCVPFVCCEILTGQLRRVRMPSRQLLLGEPP